MVDLAPELRTSIPGPRSRELSAKLGRLENPAFSERRAARAAPGEGGETLVLARGEGSNLFDVDANRYVDLAAGFGAAILGHGPSPAHAAASAQVGRLTQGLGDLYATDVKVALLEALAAIHPDPESRVMLCQSGADAVTAALKTCVLETGRPGVLAFEGAYHGLSYAPLAACGFVPSFREPFAAQLGNHVRFVPYPRSEGALDSTLAAVAALLAGGEIGAILVEPILGRGGVVVPPPGFVAELARLARAHGALLVADEIWTGMGRGGSLVHSLAGGVVPDLLCLGKGLGASFPISACLGTGRAMSAWARGGSVVHTSTHAGAPFACAAALATIDAVRSQDLGARAAAVGRRFQDALRSALAGDSRVREVRGAGLLVGMEMASGREGIAVLRSLLGRGYVATAGGFDGAVVVFTPPLTIDEPVLLDSAAVVAACVGALP